MKQIFTLITLVTLLYGSACKQTAESKTEVDTELSKEEIIEKEIAIHKDKWKDITPYSMSQKLVQDFDGGFDLEVTLEPNSGSYILSHYSREDFIGKFTIELDSDKYITSNGDLIESPETGTVYEPFSRSDQRAITCKTLCSQRYSVSTKEDFIEKGQITFVIEPKCSLEKHPFQVTRKAGVLALEMLDLPQE